MRYKITKANKFGGGTKIDETKDWSWSSGQRPAYPMDTYAPITVDGTQYQYPFNIPGNQPISTEVLGDMSIQNPESTPLHSVGLTTHKAPVVQSNQNSEIPITWAPGAKLSDFDYTLPNSESQTQVDPIPNRLNANFKPGYNLNDQANSGIKMSDPNYINDFSAGLYESRVDAPQSEGWLGNQD